MFDGLLFESMPNAGKTMERPCAFVDSIPVPLQSKFADASHRRISGRCFVSVTPAETSASVRNAG